VASRGTFKSSTNAAWLKILASPDGFGEQHRLFRQELHKLLGMVETRESAFVEAWNEFFGPR
jgi:hypothetical protein